MTNNDKRMEGNQEKRSILGMQQGRNRRNTNKRMLAGGGGDVTWYFEMTRYLSTSLSSYQATGVRKSRGLARPLAPACNKGTWNQNYSQAKTEAPEPPTHIFFSIHKRCEMWEVWAFLFFVCITINRTKSGVSECLTFRQ